MKKRVFSIGLCGCVLTLLVVASAYAQMAGTAIRINIPFAFTLRGRSLPAGNYLIRRITDEGDGLAIQNLQHSRAHSLFETEPVDERVAARHNELIFHRYGDQYFLSEIWTAGFETGRELPVSREERAVRRETAKNDSAWSGPEAVAVAIN